MREHRRRHRRSYRRYFPYQRILTSYNADYSYVIYHNRIRHKNISRENIIT
jgi:hypothetical protein